MVSEFCGLVPVGVFGFPSVFGFCGCFFFLSFLLFWCPFCILYACLEAPLRSKKYIHVYLCPNPIYLEFAVSPCPVSVSILRRALFSCLKRQPLLTIYNYQDK
jgi:hypothetical protein